MKTKQGTPIGVPCAKVRVEETAYWAAGDGLAFGDAGVFFVDFFFVVLVAAGLGLAAGLAAGAGLAAAEVAFGESAKATIGSAAQARISISFFMSVFPSSGSRANVRNRPAIFGQACQGDVST
jgi:hypothetical protein